jgi:hypothetical protein
MKTPVRVALRTIQYEFGRTLNVFHGKSRLEGTISMTMSVDQEECHVRGE